MAQGSGSRAAHWTLRLRRSKEKVREGLRSMQPWEWTLKRIGGTLGFGLASWDGTGPLGLREEGLVTWTPGSEGGGAGGPDPWV